MYLISLQSKGKGKSKKIKYVLNSFFINPFTDNRKEAMKYTFEQGIDTIKHLKFMYPQYNFQMVLN